MSILKSERAERDGIRLDRDQYRMRVEPQKYMRQKEAELDHLLKMKEIEMEKKLRRFFYAGKSRGRTSDKRSPRDKPPQLLMMAPRQPDPIATRGKYRSLDSPLPPPLRMPPLSR